GGGPFIGKSGHEIQATEFGLTNSSDGDLASRLDREAASRLRIFLGQAVDEGGGRNDFIDRPDALAAAPYVLPRLLLRRSVLEAHCRGIRDRQIVGVHAGIAYRALQIIAVDAGEEV